MRSRLIVVLACLLIAWAFAACTGCAGSEAEARDRALEGDALFNKAIDIGNDLDRTKAEIQRLMVENDIAGLVAMEPEIRAILTAMDKSSKSVEGAIAEYREVIGLKGVDAYKEYVAIQMEAAFKEQEALAVGRELVNYVLGLLDQVKVGTPVNFTDSLKAVSVTVNTLDKLERELVSFRRQAADFATDNNLF